jgi:hypothetical protein
VLDAEQPCHTLLDRTPFRPSTGPALDSRNRSGGAACGHIETVRAPTDQSQEPVMCSHDAPRASVILRRSSPPMQHALVSSQLSTSTTHSDRVPSLLHPLFRSPPDLTPHTSPCVVPIALHSYLPNPTHDSRPAALAPSGLRPWVQRRSLLACTLLPETE